ncbi:hypothetical protein DFH08DRAFT_679484, partial [Mycena albidolilacea]
MSTHGTVYAEVEAHTSRPPVLTKGDITPLVIRNFENAALNWFALKAVAPGSQVSNILGSFRDPRYVAWLRPNAERSRVMKLSFNGFMSELRQKYLPVDWQAVTRNEILSSRMKDTQSFDEFYTEVIGLGSLLEGTDAELSTTRIRHTLKAGMCADLEVEYREELTIKAIAVDEMDKWSKEVRRIDEKRMRNLATQRRIAAEIHKAEKRKAGTDGERNSKKPFGSSSKPNTSLAAASGPSTPSAASSTPKGCPKLTDSERALLSEHEGRYKCRRFYAGHRSNNCSNDFPDPSTYRTLTANDA